MDKPFAITLDIRSSLANHTGTWRSQRPVYVDALPPCSHACPAGEQVQGWLYTAEDGSYEKAWRQLVADNPLPAIMGRICYHPCETACNRAEMDTAVGINSVERFLGDEAITRGWALDPPTTITGGRVLVVGGGPAGISAAYHLRRAGREVEIHDAGTAGGGMMRSAIPTYRLPRDVLDAEIARLLAIGVTFHPRSCVTDLDAVMRDGRFDAAYLAIGAQLSHNAYVPAVQAAHVVDALTVLADTASGERPLLGRAVVVYGGGNTAMDAARSAKRLGAEDAVIVYRRTEAQMPAHPTELRDALEEGVQVKWLRTISHVGEAGLTLEKMTLDDQARPIPTGEYELLPADAVVLAVGQDVDRSLLDRIDGVDVVDGLVRVDATHMTGHVGVFAGGDAVSVGRSVTAALGQGRAAARSIDSWIRTGAGLGAGSSGQPVPFSRLNTWYYSDAPHAVRPKLDAARRTDDFTEVVGGLEADTAMYEARRCLSCGNCFGCDNCYGVCPDNAVHKVDSGHGYAIDYDFCKGCGLCVSECPAGAIDLIPEPS